MVRHFLLYVVLTGIGLTICAIGNRLNRGLRYVPQNKVAQNRGLPISMLRMLFAQVSKL